MAESDIIEAVRLNDLLLDPETGEILSEQDIGIDVLALQLKDGQEQLKAWEQAVTLLKLAIGRKLDDANIKAAPTPYGTAVRRTQLRRSASAEKVPELAERFGLDDDQQAALYSCARELDPKKLEGLKGWEKDLEDAIDALIEERIISYIQLQPLRKAAPTITRETADKGNY